MMATEYKLSAVSTHTDVHGQPTNAESLEQISTIVRLSYPAGVDTVVLANALIDAAQQVLDQADPDGAHVLMALPRLHPLETGAA